MTIIALNLISTEIRDKLITALFNMLIHSLWQGVLLAVIAGLIIVLTKRSSSALRYNLLAATLLLFAICTTVTFVAQIGQSFNTRTSSSFNRIFISEISARTDHTPVIVQPGNITSSVFSYLQSYHDIIVLIWFLVICMKSIQFGVGLHGAYQLKREGVFPVSDYWKRRLQELSASLGIRQTILLLESGLAKVPMVIGNLKPVILIPVGLLTALSVAEVEAILVHELAHIRRRDYIVNMIQSLMEMIFFFNPAVLWISQLIKTERENCCDDLVLAQNNNKESYIHALLSCDGYEPLASSRAMAFPGGKSSLFDRAKRIVAGRNHSLNLFEKTALGICLVVSGLCLSAFVGRENVKHVVASALHYANNQLQLKTPAPDKQLSDTKIPEKTSPKASAIVSEEDGKLSLVNDPEKVDANSAISAYDIEQDDPNIHDKIWSDPNSKFYTRIPIKESAKGFYGILDGSPYDLVIMSFKTSNGLGGSMCVSTINRNAKVVFISENKIYEEDEMANFTQAQIEAFHQQGSNGVGNAAQFMASNTFPGLDLSKYEVCFYSAPDPDRLVSLGAIPNTSSHE